ncbi:hypothetical protein PN36_12850 [Candidatus Thiomargarita nelsonii]|uniref:Uncharacterized protein n=1 Tax=Candidatus Thiomargarita nelsonii TaxID=1003181 RepID=A0A0A6RRF3_9GAMM|nr:hypothetical protein PN36_12850 [Candidatus Thiomargarita nelsonii]
MIELRSFRLWEFNVNHNQLLLRSPQNVDIAFVGVGYVELPTKLDGITICQPSANEIERICERLGSSVAPDEIHVLSSGGKRYLVVAKKIWDNDLDIFESSLEHFSRPATPKGVRHYPN